jgi:hypothetical protein
VSDAEVLHRTPETIRSAVAWLVVAAVAGAVVGIRSPVPGAGVAAIGLVLAVRTLRAEVRLGPDAVRVRGLLRTRTVAYDRIESVAAVRSGPGAGTEVVEIRLVDGSRVRADSTGCAPGSGPNPWSDVDAMVAAIAARSRALQ